RYTDGDGRVVHSVVEVGRVRFAVKDAGDGDPAPSGGGGPVIMSLRVSGRDAVAARMRAAGASTIFEVADHGYGEYGGRLGDPFGHPGVVKQKIEEMTGQQTPGPLDATG